MSVFLQSLFWNTFVAFWIIASVFLAKFFISKATKYLEYITATTVWLLLGIIFLWFIPKLSNSWFVWERLWITILFGLLIFYLLELFLHWHHCRDLEHNSCCNHEHNHDKHKSWILMFGSTIMHNSFHWIVLFSAYSVNFHFWLATTFAVLLHSIPQNIVNYIMNKNNIKYAYFAAIWTILWALLMFPFSDFILKHKFYVLAIISWGLLYTALADIFPEFKEKWTIKQKIFYLIFIFIWIFMFLGFEKLSLIFK
jgi:zinc and cadmium transporter